MQKCLRVGKINEPIAKQTKMGWVIMSPVRESDLVSSLYTRILVSDFDRLCDIDVLGVEDNHLGHDETVYKKLKQKLKRNDGEGGAGRGAGKQQQQIWESRTPEINFETASTKPRYI